MILPEARAELSGAITELINGRISNDEFDEVYYGLCFRSPDRTVAELGGFAWGLYSSDLLMPYYLEGRHALAPEERAMMERALLFLSTDLEYAWPEFPGTSYSWSVQHYILLPVGVVALLYAVLWAVFVSPAGIWDGIVPVVIVVVPVVWLYWLLGHARHLSITEFWASDPKHVWPFTSEEDYHRAVATGARE